MIIKQILLVQILVNVQRTVWGICIMEFGCNVLIVDWYRAQLLMGLRY